MTEKSRSTEELVDASVESEVFIDAILDLAQANVGVSKRPRSLKASSELRQQPAVDMIDGDALASATDLAPSAEADEVLVDLTDGAIDPIDGAPLAAPVAKAVSRSAATARAAAGRPAQPEPEPEPVRAEPARPSRASSEPPSRSDEPVPVAPPAVASQSAASSAASVPQAPTPSESSQPVTPEPAQPAAPGASAGAASSGATARRSRPPVVDLRGAMGTAAPVKRRRSRIRRLRRAFREYMIRRSRGSAKVPLTARWRSARLRRMREQRRAATQAAMLGQDPAEVRVSEPNLVGYAAAVLVVAALAVIVLIVVT